MEQLLIAGILGVFGLIIGSFGGATVWRLRARQLQEDKAAGERISSTEYNHLKKLLGKTVSTDRSMCLHCHHQLEWYDLIPLVSWASLLGKCRYCHKLIGYMEPLIEVGMAAFFIISYLAWPGSLLSTVGLLEFGLWLAIGAGLIILFAYDFRWYLLPDRVMFPLMGLAVLMAGLHIFFAEDKWAYSIGLMVACTILSGLYYVIYVVSQGKWIGFGDIKLGLVLALALGEWPLAFLTLFLANLIGCIVVLPGLLLGKMQRSAHVPFGPMLILGYFIVGLFGQMLLAWYLGR